MQRSERSFVTVLVADTVSSTESVAGLDPDDAEQLLSGAFQSITEAVSRAGGVLVSYAGDGGLAVFGWPASLENHADQACIAAWDIQHPEDDAVRAGEEGSALPLRIGVHSGLVGFRELELESGRRLDVVGGTVHLAAALEKAAAPGDVLISSTTASLCRTRLVLIPGDTPEVALREGLGVYRLRSRPRDAGRAAMIRRHRNRMVGREAELAWTEEVIAHHDPPYAAIVGEPGLGKSRLAAAVVAESDGASMHVVVTGGNPHRRSSPFGVVRQAIALALGGEDQADPSDLRTLFDPDSLPDAEAEPIERALAAVERVRGRSAEPQGGSALYEVYADLLIRAAGAERLLLVVEDLHFVDPESVRSLSLLKTLDRDRRIALLTTLRPEARDVATDLGADTLELRSLDAVEMSALAEAMVGARKPDDGDLARIIAMAEGVPFVLEQAIYAFAQAGSGGTERLPSGVESVIHARLNTLRASTKELCQILGVLGPEVEYDIAMRVARSSVPQFDEDLKELVELAVLHPATGDKIEFRHAILSDACANMLPRARRQEIHRHAVAAINELRPGADGYFERLAYHCEEAGDYESALDWYWKECERLHQHLASGSLLQMFDRAVACIDRIGEAAEERLLRLSLLVFAALIQLGEMARMREHLPRMTEIARRRGHLREQSSVLCQSGLMCWFDGRYAEGHEVSEQAMALAEDQASLPLIFAAGFNLATMKFMMGDLGGALDVLEDLTARLQGPLETSRLGAVPIPSSILRSYISWCRTERGEYDLARIEAEQAEEIARRCDETYSETLALVGFGKLYRKQGRNDAALEVLGRARGLAERCGYDAAFPAIIGMFVSSLARSGCLDDLAGLVERFRVDRRLSRSGQSELCVFHAGMSEALDALGERDAADDELANAEDIARRIGSPTHLANVLRLRIARLGAAPSARDEMNRLRSELDQVCRRHGLAESGLDTT